jgi:phosphoenolpyruvate carboxykinase (GTP)
MNIQTAHNVSSNWSSNQPEKNVHQNVLSWVNEVATLVQPDDIYWCDGTDAEYDRFMNELVEKKCAVKLNDKLRPNSYAVFSDANDVARVEDRTFICSQEQEDAGPTNNWCEPAEMKDKLKGLFEGSMRGRTLYVVPFSMGPLGSPFSIIGIQLTDSVYVAASMKIMATMGRAVLDRLQNGEQFIPCLHSIGAPLAKGEIDKPWPSNSEKYICHFPETKEIWSFGSGYGGNALLGKKCLALRVASVIAKENGWLAEHMLILKLTNPEGKVRYLSAAFPSACGKTNLAMLEPALPDWKVECVGDDIAWLRPGEDGQLYAINPEAGFFGVAPGTSQSTNPNAMASLNENCVFTNVATTAEGDIWWEGMTDVVPEGITDWKGNAWSADSDSKAAHPNARFTVSAGQCPVIADEWKEGKPVPISAILFGGRRRSVIPLVCEANNWKQGVLMGSTVASETTAAATGAVGQVRRDPMSMLPFCGYNVGDYFKHWLEVGGHSNAIAFPKIYNVNWFQKNEEGKFIWPGFGENIRVLKWIFERCEGSTDAVASPLGNLPTKESIDISDLNLPSSAVDALLNVNHQQWLEEIVGIKAFYDQLGERLPAELVSELAELESRFANDQ